MHRVPECLSLRWIVSPHALPRKRVCLPSWTKEGEQHSIADEGAQFRQIDRKPGTLYILWGKLYKIMDEGRERDNTSRVGGIPTLPGLNLSTFQPSQRGFFRVHTSMWRERDPEPKFANFSGPQASIPKNWQIGFGKPLSTPYTNPPHLISSVTWLGYLDGPVLWLAIYKFVVLSCLSLSHL